MATARALNVLRLIDVGAKSAHQVVVGDSGGEKLVSTAVGAGADPAARLRVPAAVGVEVGVGDVVEDTQETTVRVDRLDILTRSAVERIVVTSPCRTGGVQTCKSSCISIV